MKMKKKNKRSYFRKVENRKYKNRRNKLLKYIPKQPKLIQFLIDNEADEGFIKGLQLTTSFSRRRAFIREDIHDSICSSFTWASTKEGHYYWSNLQDRFMEWYRENK